MADVSTLFDHLNAFREQPVDDWHPDKVVDMDIVVNMSGKWLYQGTEFTRHSIVKLFSTVLRREGDEFFLVTPPVKYRITVADVPFLRGNGESKRLPCRLC